MLYITHETLDTQALPPLLVNMYVHVYMFVDKPGDEAVLEISWVVKAHTGTSVMLPWQWVIYMYPVCIKIIDLS